MKTLCGDLVKVHYYFEHLDTNKTYKIKDVLNMCQMMIEHGEKYVWFDTPEDDVKRTKKRVNPEDLISRIRYSESGISPRNSTSKITFVFGERTFKIKLQ